jgi:hypothetical protein
MDLNSQHVGIVMSGAMLAFMFNGLSAVVMQLLDKITYLCCYDR